jgi:hypothetical protein
MAHDLHRQLGLLLTQRVPAFFMIDEVALGPRLDLASFAMRSPVSACALESIR